jgi:hypothetical protein
MNHNAPTITMAIYFSSPSCPAVGETIPFERADQCVHRRIAKLLEEVLGSYVVSDGHNWGFNDDHSL